MSLSQAIVAVGAMLDRWPNGRANVTDEYIAGLARQLIDYPRMIAAKACGPTGVVRETKFLPTGAEVYAFCEREVEPLRAILERDDREQARKRALAALPIAPPREQRPTLAELQAAHGGPSFGLAEVEPPQPVGPSAVQLGNERAWAKLGGVVSAGLTITDALVATIDPTRCGQREPPAGDEAYPPGDLGAVNRQSPGDVDPPEGQRGAEVSITPADRSPGDNSQEWEPCP